MKYSFVFIKPHIIMKGSTIDVIQKFIDNGFLIIDPKVVSKDCKFWEQFYIEHKEKPFYDDMCKKLEDKIVIGFLLKHSNEQDDMISFVRKFIGNTNPAVAEENTVRFKFGVDIENNAVHASDSIESFKREIELFGIKIKEEEDNK